VKVSGLPRPRFFRFDSAKRPNSISRVFNSGDSVFISQFWEFWEFWGQCIYLRR
jgi:hypothetical protein